MPSLRKCFREGKLTKSNRVAHPGTPKQDCGSGPFFGSKFQCGSLRVGEWFPVCKYRFLSEHGWDFFNCVPNKGFFIVVKESIEVFGEIGLRNASFASTLSFLRLLRFSWAIRWFRTGIVSMFKRLAFVLGPGLSLCFVIHIGLLSTGAFNDSLRSACTALF